MAKRGIFRWEVDEEEYCWERYDYGDTLTVSSNRQAQIPSKLNNASQETHQCFVIHLAAAVLWLKLLREPTTKEVMALAASILDDLAETAAIAED